VATFVRLELSWARPLRLACADTGPDARRLAAVRECIRLTAWNAAELSARIADAERLQGWES